jgi:hypothetical protein
MLTKNTNMRFACVLEITTKSMKKLQGQNLDSKTRYNGFNIYNIYMYKPIHVYNTYMYILMHSCRGRLRRRARGARPPPETTSAEMPTSPETSAHVFPIYSVMAIHTLCLQICLPRTRICVSLVFWKSQRKVWKSCKGKIWIPKQDKMYWI